MPAHDDHTEVKTLSGSPFPDDCALRTSRCQATAIPTSETEATSGEYTSPSWTVPKSVGLSSEKALVSQLESLDWRLARLEVAFVSLVRIWTWANRVYQRLGHGLLHTRPEVGVTGALLHYPDGTIKHSGVVTGIRDGVGHAGRFQLESALWPWLKLTHNFSAVTRACLAVRRTLFEQLGGFDIYFYNNYNDVDLCLRAQNAGLEVVLTTTANLCHSGARTCKNGSALHERFDFGARWGNVLSESDYFYSPNLSGRLETIDLAIPSWR